MLLQLAMALRLHFRNKLAFIYSYVFPTLFLLAFWVLYRYDQVPLARHIGELLTVTALGGACFGLPTSLVSERERGVWRRYRLAPVRTGQIVASTLVARYALLVLAAVLQLTLAMALGMPLPRHPVELWLAFTAVAIAFLGLGMVIAMLANTVPAVQALGQCIFLPMLIIGGVAVPLASLPPWAQRRGVVLSGTLRGRCHSIDGDRPRAWRRGLQRCGAPRHRRRRLPRRRAHVPLGFTASARHRGVRLAGCRTRRVGRRRSGRRRARNRNSTADPSARNSTSSSSGSNSYSAESRVRAPSLRAPSPEPRAPRGHLSGLAGPHPRSLSLGGFAPRPSTGSGRP